MAGTLRALLDEVAAMLPARVQKASVGQGRAGPAIVFAVYTGERWFLTVDVEAATVRRVADRPGGDERGAGNTAPPQAQAVLRKEVVPSMITACALDEARGLARLTFTPKEGPTRALVVELDRADPRAVLITAVPGEVERVLAVVGAPRPPDGRDLRRGRPYEAPRARGTVELDVDLDEPRAPVVPAVPKDAWKDLRAALKAEQRRAARLVAALAADLAKHGDPVALGAEGELLKGALATVRRGDPEVVIDGRTITLDVEKDAVQNMAARFARAKKARTAIQRTEPRIAAARSRLAAVEAARARITGPAPSKDDEAAARAALTTVDAGPSARRKAATTGPRRAWRSFTCTGGVVVRVGRSARDNDELTMKSAHGNDLWLHARGTPGAHVIVPSDGGDVPPELFLDAAHLAVWFSPLRDERRADVQYTRVKKLKKPKGSSPGFVTVAGELVTGVRVDEERMKRLLAAETAST